MIIECISVIFLFNYYFYIWIFVVRCVQDLSFPLGHTGSTIGERERNFLKAFYYIASSWFVGSPNVNEG